MAVFLQYKDDDLQWAIWKTDESIDELLAMLPHPYMYRQQLTRLFRTEHRQLEWLSVRVLLYHLLGKEKEILYTYGGKPFLSDRSYYLSISHTKGYVAIILSAKSEVGVDIEQYGNRIQKVVHKFVRDDEVLPAYKEDNTWGALLNWSAKEVMFKCMDSEGVDFREHLYIEPFSLPDFDEEKAAYLQDEEPTAYPQGTFRAREYKTMFQRTFLIHYLLHPDFVFTWSIE